MQFITLRCWFFPCAGHKCNGMWDDKWTGSLACLICSPFSYDVWCLIGLFGQFYKCKFNEKIGNTFKRLIRPGLMPFNLTVPPITTVIVSHSSIYNKSQRHLVKDHHGYGTNKFFLLQYLNSSWWIRFSTSVWQEQYFLPCLCWEKIKRKVWALCPPRWTSNIID